MMWFHAALWGLFGSFAVEGLDLWAAVRRRGVWPWRVRGPQEVGALGYLVAELVRLVIGGGLASAAMVSGQITTPVGALAVGIAAPLIVERLTRPIPLTDSAPDTGSAQDTVGGEEHPTDSELDGQRAPVEEHRSSRCSHAGHPRLNSTPPSRRLSLAVSKPCSTVVGAPPLQLLIRPGPVWC